MSSAACPVHQLVSPKQHGTLLHNLACRMFSGSMDIHYRIIFKRFLSFVSHGYVHFEDTVESLLRTTSRMKDILCLLVVKKKKYEFIAPCVCTCRKYLICKRCPTQRWATTSACAACATHVMDTTEMGSSGVMPGCCKGLTDIVKNRTSLGVKDLLPDWQAHFSPNTWTYLRV